MAVADKFYTKDEVVKKCLDRLSKFVSIEGNILEPSAGNGSFLNHLPNNTVALDLIPEDDRITEMNFFDFKTDKEFITIGNPPFGKRSKLAIDFFNHAATFSKVIAFIVPVSFMKYGVQKNLNKDFKLIDYMILPPNSFMDREKEFSVRCVFQIWAKEGEKDFRLKSNPPISHKDFKLWQYNATEQSLNTIDEDWEIALYRQGYHDYNQVFTRNDYDFIKDKMTGERKVQFFFIKPNNDEVKNKILSLDFNALAERNTSTPGFGKGDFVQYYCENFQT